MRATQAAERRRRCSRAGTGRRREPRERGIGGLRRADPVVALEGAQPEQDGDQEGQLHQHGHAEGHGEHGDQDVHPRGYRWPPARDRARTGSNDGSTGYSEDSPPSQCTIRSRAASLSSQAATHASSSATERSGGDRAACSAPASAVVRVRGLRPTATAARRPPTTAATSRGRAPPRRGRGTSSTTRPARRSASNLTLPPQRLATCPPGRGCRPPPCSSAASVPTSEGPEDGPSPVEPGEEALHDHRGPRLRSTPPSHGHSATPSCAAAHGAERRPGVPVQRRMERSLHRLGHAAGARARGAGRGSGAVGLRGRRPTGGEAPRGELQRCSSTTWPTVERAAAVDEPISCMRLERRRAGHVVDACTSRRSWPSLRRRRRRQTRRRVEQMQQNRGTRTVLRRHCSPRLLDSRWAWLPIWWRWVLTCR